MKRIKLVEDVVLSWPDGTSRIVNLFSHRGFTIKHEQAAKLLTLYLRNNRLTWRELGNNDDEFLFESFKSYYYVDFS